MGSLPALPIPLSSRPHVRVTRSPPPPSGTSSISKLPPHSPHVQRPPLSSWNLIQPVPPSSGFQTLSMSLGESTTPSGAPTTRLSSNMPIPTRSIPSKNLSLVRNTIFSSVLYAAETPRTSTLPPSAHLLPHCPISVISIIKKPDAGTFTLNKTDYPSTTNMTTTKYLPSSTTPRIMSCPISPIHSRQPAFPVR